MDRSADKHTNHAHFSARYLAEAEASERPWGVATVINDNKGDLDMTRAEVIAAVDEALRGWSEENPDSTTTPKGVGRVGGWIRMANARELYACYRSLAAHLRAGTATVGK